MLFRDVLQWLWNLWRYDIAGIEIDHAEKKKPRFFRNGAP